MKHRKATQQQAAALATSPTEVSAQPPPVAPQTATATPAETPATPAEPPATAVALPPPDAVLSNDNIVEMVQAKVGTGIILAQIRASKTNFNLSTAEVIRLTKAGVPEAVLEQMRNPKKVVSSSAAVNPPTNGKQGKDKGPQAPPQSPIPATPAPVTLPAATPVVTAPPPVVTAPAPKPAPARVPLADASPFQITLMPDIP